MDGTKFVYNLEIHLNLYVIKLLFVLSI